MTVANSYLIISFDMIWSGLPSREGGKVRYCSLSHTLVSDEASGNAIQSPALSGLGSRLVSPGNEWAA